MISFLLHNAVFFVPTLDSVFIYFIFLLLLFIILFSLGFVFVLKKQKCNRLVLQGYSMRIAELNKAVKALILSASTEVFLFDEQKKQLYKFDGAEFQLSDTSLHDIESQIHPDDSDQYCKDYSDIINNVKESGVSYIRLYNNDSNQFDQFEYIINPIERDSEGIVTKYIFTRKNISKENTEKAKQTMQSVTMHLALRCGNLLNWQYNIEERVSKFLDGNYNEYTLTDEELLVCIDTPYRDTYKLFLQRLITNQLSEQSETLPIRMPGDDEYKKYTITAMAYFDSVDPVAISGVWKIED